jgi:hypothetical protein
MEVLVQYPSSSFDADLHQFVRPLRRYQLFSIFKSLQATASETCRYSWMQEQFVMFHRRTKCGQFAACLGMLAPATFLLPERTARDHRNVIY